MPLTCPEQLFEPSEKYSSVDILVKPTQYEILPLSEFCEGHGFASFCQDKRKTRGRRLLPLIISMKRHPSEEALLLTLLNIRPKKITDMNKLIRLTIHMITR